MNWPMARLIDVAQVNPRRDSRLRSLDESLEVTFVPMAAVDEVTGTIASPEVKLLGDVRKGFTLFVEGDVIFAKITPCMQNGKSAIAHGLVSGLGFGSTEFHVLRPGPDVLSEWLWYYVRQRTFREEARRHFRGSAGQQRVPATFIEQCEVPLPSIEVQRRIIGKIQEAFERVREIQKLRRTSLEEAAALEGAVFSDGILEFTNDAKVSIVPLGDIVGRAQYGSSSKANAHGDGVPILRMGNIQNGHLDVSDLKHISLSAKKLAKYRLGEGDILFNRTNSFELVGKAATFTGLEGNWVFASYLIRLQIDPDKALPEYVTAVINSRTGRDYVRRTARRAIGMVNINARQIQQLELPLPHLADQQWIVGQIREARAASDSIRRDLSMKPIEALLEAILHKAFSGEL